MLQEKTKLCFDELIIFISLYFLYFLFSKIIIINYLVFLFGLILILFLPGYSLLLNLFPEKDRISSIKRILFSISISLVINIFIGLILNFTPWGLSKESILYSSGIITAIFIILSIVIRRKIPSSKVYRLYAVIPSIRNLSLDSKHKLINSILFFSLISTLVIFIIVLLPNGNTEYFTEFYLMDSVVSDTGLPKVVFLNSPIEIPIGIANREAKKISYGILAKLDSEIVGAVGLIELDPGETWEGDIVIILPQVVGEQAVRFELYKEGQLEPLHVLHTWVNVNVQDDF